MLGSLGARRRELTNSLKMWAQDHPRVAMALAAGSIVWMALGVPAEVQARFEAVRWLADRPVFGELIGSLSADVEGLNPWVPVAVWVLTPVVTLVVLAVLQRPRHIHHGELRGEIRPTGEVTLAPHRGGQLSRLALDEVTVTEPVPFDGMERPAAEGSGSPSTFGPLQVRAQGVVRPPAPLPLTFEGFDQLDSERESIGWLKARCCPVRLWRGRWRNTNGDLTDLHARVSAYRWGENEQVIRNLTARIPAEVAGAQGTNRAANLISGADVMAVLAMKHRDDEGAYVLGDHVAQDDGRHPDRYLPDEKYALVVQWQSGSMHHEDWFRLTNYGDAAYFAIEHVDQPDWV